MRGNSNRLLMALLALPGLCLCQDSSSSLNARELFYHEQQDNDKLPPVRAAKSRSAPAPASQKAAPSGVPIVPVVQHLGLRYNIVLTDPNTGNTTPADPDGNFHRGDCLQIEFFPNRSGYLYVIHQGSSKVWEPLLPGPSMPDESNIVKSYTSVMVPRDHCLEIADPPGEERLFIVLSRNPADIYDLHEAIKNGQERQAQPAAAPPAASSGVLTADNRLDDAMGRVAQLESRDIKIKKIARPAKDEPPQSVYVTNVSDTGSDNLILRIRVKHVREQTGQK